MKIDLDIYMSESVKDVVLAGMTCVTIIIMIYLFITYG